MTLWKKDKTRKSLRAAKLLLAAAATAPAAILSSCEDDMSPIGGTIRPSDVSISVDSAAFDLHGSSVEALSIDSRSTTTLLGTINTPDYGRLRCSFVTQLMPAESISIPDSIKGADIDSVRLVMRIPRANITGDTLAPQQASVYRLTEQLPSDIKSSWNPAGKYSPTPLGKRNYTLSKLSMGQSANLYRNVISLQLPMPREMGAKALQQYRENPEMFEWPQSFAKEFPGLFVDATFGKGCVATIAAVNIYAYTHHQEQVSVTENDSTFLVWKDKADSTCFFSSAPEVISSNIIEYTPSDKLKALIAGKATVITTPGGYQAKLTFPAAEVLKKYNESDYDLAVINSLSMSIPAEKIANSLNIDVPPTLLMVKASEATAFFEENRVPDAKKFSFICTWNATQGRYNIASLRDYITDLNNKPEIKAEDTEFVLIPVSTEIETITQSDGSTTTVYTSCVPYLAKPTMVRLHTDRAVIVFTYSNQTLM